MAASFPIESVLPWQSDTEEDRRFKKWLFHGIGLCCTVALLFPFLPAVEPEKTELAERQRAEYTRLMIEEIKLPTPPPIVQKKQQAKPKVAPKVEPKKLVKKTVVPPVVKPVPSSKPKPVDLAKKAREKAAESGVLAFADDLAAIRQRDVNRVASSQLTKGSSKATSVSRKLLTANTNKAKATGIATAGLAQSVSEVTVADRNSVVVEQAQVDAAFVDEEYSTVTDSAGRSAQSVRKVMDGNKGAIYGIYNRALRKNPDLEGQLSFMMVIEPSGKVSAVDLVESELADQALVRKLLARIRMINFGAEPVEQTTVNYSFDFLPS